MRGRLIGNEGNEEEQRLNNTVILSCKQYLALLPISENLHLTSQPGNSRMLPPITRPVPVPVRDLSPFKGCPRFEAHTTCPRLRARRDRSDPKGDRSDWRYLRPFWTRRSVPALCSVAVPGGCVLQIAFWFARF